MEEQEKEVAIDKTLQAEIFKLESYKKRLNFIFFISIIVLCVATVTMITVFDTQIQETEFNVILPVIPVFLGFFVAYYFEKIRIDEKKFLLELSADTTKFLEKENNMYSQSIKMNYRYLDRYYLQTQDQANKGFMITVIIALVGAILIFTGVGTLYVGITEPAYITVATGSITEIISSVFFYLYNRTVTNMGKYHEKLVLSQNVAYALEIVDTLSDTKKDEAKKELMCELVKDINLYLHEKK
ncbi:hypothetical protein [uncultured Thomasclavelia sp.]|uniref:TRADD-N-associated membrane domain-containing protein n=1 Tax=uncultured Thomasclavelia sp. TaxID=3025759 RepID=UPI00262EC683|nr:hypothetical protein [uncultured Thomasclavelia sp.]